MNQWWLLAMALAAGALIPLQSGVNGRLGVVVGHPLIASLVSFAGGLLLVAVLVLAFRPAWPASEKWAQIPWYLFTGGLYGVVFVTAILFTAPKIGIANVLVAAIAGQIVTSMLLDHFGAFGVPPQPISSERLVGAALLFGGVWLVQK